jgi:glutamine amidotransferase
MPKPIITIIDYGSGNLRSCAKAFEHVIAAQRGSHNVVVSNKPEDIIKSDRIVLPGQGAFGDCIENLRAVDGMIEALEEAVLKNARPFLGICVGMQLLATRGLEYGIHAGLNWIEGEVVPMEPDDKALKIPHMGWNELVLPLSGAQDNLPPVLQSIKNEHGYGAHYYFVHSFMFKCKELHHIKAMCDYGGLFAAIVGRDNILGVQFHPEKSQTAGLNLLRDFIDWTP